MARRGRKLRVEWAAEDDAASLRARIAELAARLGQPPETPGNASVSPSRGRKPK
jgi:hypothetical protein